MFRGWTLETDIHQIRALIAQMRKNCPPPGHPDCTEEDFQIPVRGGEQITLRVHKPVNRPDRACPGMVIFHGGGFVVGDLETEAWLCHLFTSLGGVAVDVQYRHAPESPFPGPVFDSFDALKWVSSTPFSSSKLGGF